MTFANMLRVRDVKSRTGYARSTIYAYIKTGLFPRPVKMGARLSAWPANEINTLTAARTAGKSTDEIKALVNQLHEQRKLAA